MEHRCPKYDSRTQQGTADSVDGGGETSHDGKQYLPQTSAWRVFEETARWADSTLWMVERGVEPPA